MRTQRNGTGVVAGILLPMGLICLFAFCSLALALLGGQAYKQVQGVADDGYDSTVAASYLRTKLSQYNSPGAVSLRSEGDTTLLAIASGSETDYETRIYLTADGALMEKYELCTAAFDPSGGMRIAALARCEFALADDGLFSAELESPAGSVIRVAFALAQEGVA